MSDCPICQSFLCDEVSDDIYSLESPIFPWVIFCPPGYDCHLSGQLSVYCCEELLTVTWPLTMDTNATQELIVQMLNNCAVRNQFCNGTINPPSEPPHPPPFTLYRNTPQTCNSPCRDGTPSFWTEPAGRFAATTQEKADQLAQAEACRQARAHRICPPSPPCNCSIDQSSLPDVTIGANYSQALTATCDTGTHPVWTVVSGSLPDGLFLDPLTGVISGIPIGPSGSYNFTVRHTNS